MIKANSAVICVLLLIPVSVWAGNDKSVDMELLEFLGGFETSGGKHVDPLVFKQDSKNSNTKENRKPRDKEIRQQKKDKSELKERDYEQQ